MYGGAYIWKAFKLIKQPSLLKGKSFPNGGIVHHRSVVQSFGEKRFSIMNDQWTSEHIYQNRQFEEKP